MSVEETPVLVRVQLHDEWVVRFLVLSISPGFVKLPQHASL